jgi:hypothetical protein
MDQNVVLPGIRFDDYVFTEARHISQWMHPQCGGVFVILGRNTNWAPKPFEPLSFGEFGNNAGNPVATLFRLADPAAMANVFVSMLPMPFSTTAQRCSVRDQLISAYNPAWQSRGAGGPTVHLAQKLDELEKKNEEQTTQLRLLLATVNRLFEPQPAPPRRSIGFLAQPIPATPQQDF